MDLPLALNRSVTLFINSAMVDMGKIVKETTATMKQPVIMLITRKRATFHGYSADWWSFNPET